MIGGWRFAVQIGLVIGSLDKTPEPRRDEGLRSAVFRDQGHLSNPIELLVSRCCVKINGHSGSSIRRNV
jgi:hypothetical protein